jgi:hypothetical protein
MVADDRQYRQGQPGTPSADAPKSKDGAGALILFLGHSRLQTPPSSQPFPAKAELMHRLRDSDGFLEL